MPDHDKTIYKTCREAAGYTQERAAELLNISVRHLARIESGEQLPPDDIAYSMVMLYDSQYLAVQHLRRASQLAASILPPGGADHTADGHHPSLQQLRPLGGQAPGPAAHGDRGGRAYR